MLANGVEKIKSTHCNLCENCIKGRERRFIREKSIIINEGRVYVSSLRKSLSLQLRILYEDLTYKKPSCKKTVFC